MILRTGDWAKKRILEKRQRRLSYMVGNDGEKGSVRIPTVMIWRLPKVLQKTEAQIINSKFFKVFQAL